MTALHDGREPKPVKHNTRNRPEPKEKTLAGIQVRFIYEHRLAGTWFSVIDALELPVTPNEGHRVAAIQFRDLADLGLS